MHDKNDFFFGKINAHLSSINILLTTSFFKQKYVRTLKTEKYATTSYLANELKIG